MAGCRRRPGIELQMLAATSALGLLCVDGVHVIGGAIGPVYLVDALAELLFAAARVYPRIARPARPAAAAAPAPPYIIARVLEERARGMGAAAS